MGEYDAAVKGSLKLKGGQPSGVSKKKKKSKKTEKSGSPTELSEAKRAAIQKALESDDESAKRIMLEDQDKDLTVRKQKLSAEKNKAVDDEDGASIEREGEDLIASRKTDHERQMEETRRRRLIERLEKEGIKTHKERVEELNTYLSRLSEHHDMPRIGPG